MADGIPDAELDALVIACLDRMESEGEAGLEALCRAHPERAEALHKRIARLRDAGLLEGGPAGSPERMPERLGDFRLLRILGQGGMGIVYLAEQESLGRRVALKLVRPEHLYFPGARERFRREVEAVARMSHPGIVPVHMVGEDGGVPFFAMEHVAGVGLDRVIAELAPRELGSLSGRDLAELLERGEPRERSGSGSSGSSRVFDAAWAPACAAIALQVAEALEHAHQRGVMHRDVKPSNIVLRRDGRALLLDFGLASLAGDEGLTRTGSQLGSLPWMAPEVVQGARDVSWARADVYSLGATLYELCALRRAFTGANAQDLSTRIVEGRCEPLRRRNPRVGRDLAIVCAMAMEPDPSRRYASAGALARDLENVLALRPIEARPPGPALRVVRFAQRHPAAGAALALGAAVAVGGPLIYAEQQRRARVDIEAADEKTRKANVDLQQALVDVGRERDNAVRQQERAEANLDKAFEAVDLMLTKVGDEKLANVPQMELVRRELLEGALAFYGDLLQQKRGDAGLRLEFARAHERVGDVLMQLARYKEAERVFSDEVDQLRDEIAAHPDDQAPQRELGPALSKLGNALQQQSLFDRAEPVYRQAIEALRALHARYPDQNVDPSLASLSYDLGVIERRLGRLAEAEEAFGWAQAIEVPRAAEHPEDPDLAYRAGLTVLERSLLARERDPEASASGVRSALALLRGAYERAPGNAPYAHATAKAHNELADMLVRTERLEEAESELALATELYAKLARDFPNVPQYGIGLAGTEASRAQLLDSLGKSAESETAMRSARDAFAALAARYPTLADFQGNLSMTNAMLAGSMRKNGKADEALAVLRDALAQQVEGLRLAPGSAVHGKLLSERRTDLARALADGGSCAEAQELARAIPETAPRDALAHAAAAGVLAACAARSAPADAALAASALAELQSALALDAAAVLAAIELEEWDALRADAACAEALASARK